jgi:hypothetical protein
MASPAKPAAAPAITALKSWHEEGKGAFLPTAATATLARRTRAYTFLFVPAVNGSRRSGSSLGPRAQLFAARLTPTATYAQAMRSWSASSSRW